MTWLMVLFLMQDAQKEDGQTQAARIRAAMAPSLEKQRASVQRQAAAAGATMPPWTAAEPVSVPPCEPVPEPALSQMIGDTAHKQGVDPALLLAVAKQESGFRPCAVSPKGAEGLMQLMPATQAQLDVVNPFDAKESIEAGGKLLKDLLERYHGDVSLALSAYNAGAGSVDRAAGIPEIPETKNYVIDILTRLAEIP
jgi:soluble lytic murein transglycosylase-like protein